MWNDDSSLIFFAIGFMIAVFIYTRSVSAAVHRQQLKLDKKEYKRQKMLARMSGRFNDFEIKPEFEEKEE